MWSGVAPGLPLMVDQVRKPRDLLEDLGELPLTDRPPGHREALADRLQVRRGVGPCRQPAADNSAAIMRTDRTLAVGPGDMDRRIGQLRVTKERSQPR